MRAAIGLWILGAAVLVGPAAGALTQPRAEQAWRKYLEAPDAAAAKAAIDPLVAEGVDLKQALARLKAGRAG